MLNVIKVIHGQILEQAVCYLYNVKMVTELLIAISFSLVLFAAHSFCPKREWADRIGHLNIWQKVSAYPWPQEGFCHHTGCLYCLSSKGSPVGTIAARNGTGMFGPAWEQRGLLDNLLFLLAHLWSYLILTRSVKGWNTFSDCLSRASPSSQEKSRKSRLMSILVAQRSLIVLNDTECFLV